MDVWWPEIPLWEVVVRSVLTFFVLLIFVRLMAKRDLGESSPSDLILLLLLTANVEPSIAGKDKSILGGLMGAGVLVMLNAALNKFAYRSKLFERKLKGSSELLIHDGETCDDVMKKHSMSFAQLRIAIRKEGVLKVSDVRLAVLEPDGSISVVKMEDEPKPIGSRDEVMKLL